MKYKTEIVCTYNNECVQDIDYVKFPLGMNTKSEQIHEWISDVMNK